MAFFKTIEAVRILVLSGLLVPGVSVRDAFMPLRAGKRRSGTAPEGPWFQRLFKRHCNPGTCLWAFWLCTWYSPSVL
jgi:hypothetical protein